MAQIKITPENLVQCLNKLASTVNLPKCFEFHVVHQKRHIVPMKNTLVAIGEMATTTNEKVL